METSIGAIRLIHTNISGPFRCQTICGNKYFRTFIDDFSRYCHVYLINEKSQSSESLKSSKQELKNSLGRRLKWLEIHKGGEYY